MSEPTKESPKTPKRHSKRKPAMEPLGWDEIVSQPGMGGYLSFLNGPVPLPHLQPSTPAITAGPGVAVVLEPDPISAPDVTSAPGVPTAPSPGPAPAFLPAPEIVSIAGALQMSGVVPVPGVAPDTLGRLRIRKCRAAQDGHSLGEEILYQALWKAATPEPAGTRIVVIGWRGMSQLCRMTPKNCKINTHRLIRKLAMEVLSPYNTPESIGTTYRIFANEAIFERRCAAGLEWVVRSRGVEFVDPATGMPRGDL